ncbi:FAD-dependent oxidoreductase [Chloroflexota bacterium]
MNSIGDNRRRASKPLLRKVTADCHESTSSTPSVQDTSKLRPWLPDKWDYEADVVVIGYGGAGVCAAIAAYDTGANVLILEKAPVNGGNTRVAVGGSSIPSDITDAIEYYRAHIGATVDEESIHTLAEAIVQLPGKLKEWGIELEYFPYVPVYPTLPGSDSFRRVGRLARTPQQIKGGVWFNYAEQLFDVFEEQVKKRGIKVMYETPAKELIQDPVTKEILGATVGGSKQEIHIKARRGIVLACGGFENNREMLLNYLSHIEKLPLYPSGTPYNTGDGILMASAVGAKLWHMAGIELGNFGPKAPSERFGVGFRLLRQLPPGSQVIYINKHGKRFMNDAVTLSHRKDWFKVQHFDDDHAEYPNIPFYMIFDETYRRKGPIVETRYGWWCVHKLYEWSDDNSAEIDLGWIVKANTIKELAIKMGIDPDALGETIREYNEFCKIGEDPKFGRSKEWLVPIDTPPYYGTELCAPITNTQGGPKHNSRAQVLDINDKPIPRLYAAGELGSFFFPLYPGACNIPEALAFGCIAGEEVSTLIPWDRHVP